MQQLAKKLFEEAGWGIPASIGLHLIFAFLLLYRIHNVSPPAEDQSVNVELVPPKPSEDTSDSKSNTDAKPPAQAFESASTEKKPPAQTESSEPPIVPDNPHPVAKEESKVLQKSDNNAQSETELHTEDEGMTAATKTTAQAQASRTPTVAADKPSEVTPKLTPARQIYSKETLSDPRVKQAIGKLPPRDRIVQICGIEALEQVRHQRPGTFPDMLAPSAGVVSDTSFTIRDGAFRSRAKWYSIDFQCQVDTKAMTITNFSYSIGKAIPEVQWHSRQLPKD
ncbi:DUF930 domain-containing protein [Brucella rhizosphaerae]|uniref:DUF930 domain-containing protein n=2 Tax=Brucella rhizosphaerae TaxID=571254 RepID=A0A256FXQ7_9HYPH|nr:DUF930 domain-containing protein [Brucella rhizosphaerae]OYR19619.1 hypothetical protein CEV32_4930 [Brucella rhizosphaerae]